MEGKFEKTADSNSPPLFVPDAVWCRPHTRCRSIPDSMWFPPKLRCPAFRQKVCPEYKANCLPPIQNRYVCVTRVSKCLVTLHFIRGDWALCNKPQSITTEKKALNVHKKAINQVVANRDLLQNYEISGCSLLAFTIAVQVLLLLVL